MDTYWELKLIRVWVCIFLCRLGVDPNLGSNKFIGFRSRCGSSISGPNLGVQENLYKLIILEPYKFN